MEPSQRWSQWVWLDFLIKWILRILLFSIPSRFQRFKPRFPSTILSLFSSKSYEFCIPWQIYELHDNKMATISISCYEIIEKLFIFQQHKRHLHFIPFRKLSRSEFRRSNIKMCEFLHFAPHQIEKCQRHRKYATTNRQNIKLDSSCYLIHLHIIANISSFGCGFTCGKHTDGERKLKNYNPICEEFNHSIALMLLLLLLLNECGVEWC